MERVADLHLRSRDYDNSPVVELLATGQEREDLVVQIRIRVINEDRVVAETTPGAERKEVAK